MDALFAGLGGAMTCWGLGLLAWSALPRRLEGWTQCDFGPAMKLAALLAAGATAFLAAAAWRADPSARPLALVGAAALGLVAVHLLVNAFLYRCRWDLDGLTVEAGPFLKRRLAWRDVRRYGFAPLRRAFWVADAKGRRIWWSPVMRGAEPLRRAVERAVPAPPGLALPAPADRGPPYPGNRTLH